MSEFSGIINNGLERGWSKEEIRTSLLNAGFPQQEIIAELNSIGSTPSAQAMQPPSVEIKPLDKYQTLNAKPKKKMGLLIGILLLSFLLFLGIIFGIYFLI